MFLILYNTLGRQQVILYYGNYLRCSTEGETTRYTGKSGGREIEFTVSSDLELTQRVGNTLFGPYSIVFDSDAIPEEEVLNRNMNLTRTDFFEGVEVWEEDTCLFRGGYFANEEMLFLVDEEGETLIDTFLLATAYSESIPEPPEVYTILKIALLPEVTQRGDINGLLMGMFCCVMCVLALWFEDELFRFNMSFQIRDAENVEPSEWELASRWLGWGMFTVLAVISFVMGLSAG